MDQRSLWLFYIPWHLVLSALFEKAKNVLKTLMTVSTSPAIRPQRGNKYQIPHFEERIWVPRSINQTRHTVYNMQVTYNDVGKISISRCISELVVPLGPHHEWYFHSVTIQRPIHKLKEHFTALKEVQTQNWGFGRQSWSANSFQTNACG